MKSLFLVLVAAMLLTSCLGRVRREELVTEKVKARASFDFECDKAKINITKIDEMAYGAVGCGKKGTYVLEGPTGACAAYQMWESILIHDCTAVLNTPSKGTDSK